MSPPSPSRSIHRATAALDSIPLSSRSRLPGVLTLSVKDEGSAVEPTTVKPKREDQFSLRTDWDGELDKLVSHYEGQRILGVEPAREYRPTTLPSNSDSNIYTIQAGCRTYTVKLGDSPEHVKTELYNHLSVEAEINVRWRAATRSLKKAKIKVYPGPCDSKSGRDNKIYGVKLRSLPMIRVPNFMSEIIEQGAGTVTTGFVTQFIPPLHRFHARALVNTFLDPSIRESVNNDPDLKNVRLRVFLGEMAPPDEAKSPRLLSRPVYSDQLICGADPYMDHWAKQMGAALAIMHWCCHLDATGVKFYLAPGRHKSKLWMTNFGDCRLITLGPNTAKELAQIISDNSAFPRCLFANFFGGSKEHLRRMNEIYDAFTGAYLSTSREILTFNSMKLDRDYPDQVVSRLLYLSLCWSSKKNRAKRLGNSEC